METQAVAIYRGSLSELNSLSKVEINALTMMAEDNKDFAVQIAACIENHLRSVPGEQKLPILYLIDSICKNYPNSSYVQLFTQNIVSNFCNVFEASNEKTRQALYKLRKTWKDAKTFPPRKLTAIDQRVHEIDPAWPIKESINATETTQKTKTQTQQQLQNNRNQQQSGGIISPPSSISDTSNGKNLNNTISRNKQPKNRGAKKLRTSNNNNGSGNNNTMLGHGQNQNVIVSTAATGGLPMHVQAQQTIHPITHSMSPFYPHILPPGPQQVAATIPAFQQPPSPNPYPTITTYGYPAADGIYSDITPMLQSQPQIPMTQPLQPALPISQQPLTQPQFSDLDQMTLKSLYGGKQCSNCSLRFDDNNKYAIHLDWHFRQNFKSDSVFARRKWYYPLNLWVQFREINDDDVQENISSDNNNANDLLILHQNDLEVPTAPASKEDDKNICSVCHETFEKFWAEEEEEWRLRNARLHDDERVYHPLCLMDMLQASV